MKGALGCVNCGLSGEKFASVRALGVECETLLPSGDWLNFGYKSNNHCPNYFWVRLRRDVFQILFYGKLGVVRAITSQ